MGTVITANSAEATINHSKAILNSFLFGIFVSSS